MPKRKAVEVESEEPVEVAEEAYEAPVYPRRKKVGSRQEVFHGFAERTSGGLKAEDLEQKANGSIVSKKRSQQARLALEKRGGFSKAVSPS